MLNSGPQAAILDWTDGHGNYVHLCWFLHTQLGIQATLFFLPQKKLLPYGFISRTSAAGPITMQMYRHSGMCPIVQASSNVQVLECLLQNSHQLVT